jgi:hypothetical protein
MRPLELLTLAMVMMVTSVPPAGTRASEPQAPQVKNECSSHSTPFPTKVGPVGFHSVDTAIKRAFAKSGFGMSNKEFGFAVIANGDGSFTTTNVTGGESGIWRASVPASVVAIFHTHRSSVSPRPSDDDMDEADRLQVPYYVISSSGLWVYEPDPQRKVKGRTFQASGPRTWMAKKGLPCS